MFCGDGSATLGRVCVLRGCGRGVPVPFKPGGHGPQTDPNLFQEGISEGKNFGASCLDGVLLQGWLQYSLPPSLRPAGPEFQSSKHLGNHMALCLTLCLSLLLGNQPHS